VRSRELVAGGREQAVEWIGEVTVLEGNWFARLDDASQPRVHRDDVAACDGLRSQSVCGDGNQRIAVEAEQHRRIAPDESASCGEKPGIALFRRQIHRERRCELQQWFVHRVVDLIALT
jgi:hypothetical protein